MVNLSEMSTEELADAAKRGIITEIALTQQELIKVMQEKERAMRKYAEVYEKEAKLREKLDGIY